MRGVYALGDLVDVAAVPAHEREQLAQLREVELQDAPVRRTEQVPAYLLCSCEGMPGDF